MKRLAALTFLLLSLAAVATIASTDAEGSTAIIYSVEGGGGGIFPDCHAGLNGAQVWYLTDSGLIYVFQCVHGYDNWQCGWGESCWFWKFVYTLRNV